MKALPWIIAAVGIGTVLTYLLVNEPQPRAASGWDPVEEAANRAKKFGIKAQVSGTVSNATGKLKEGVGGVVGDPDLADEGVVDQAEGSVKKAAGVVADSVGQTIHDLSK